MVYYDVLGWEGGNEMEGLEGQKVACGCSTERTFVLFKRVFFLNVYLISLPVFRLSKNNLTG